jgi:hypothetical protein
MQRRWSGMVCLQGPETPQLVFFAINTPHLLKLQACIASIQSKNVVAT